MKLAVYARQSKADRDKVPSTTWQIDECRKAAAALGHQVTVVHSDVDRSGSKAAVKRPGFESLLSSLPDVDGTIVWRLDRLSRQGQWGRDTIRFMEAKGDTALLSVVEEVDTSTAAGELILGVRLSMAKGEAEAIGSRWKSQKRREAEAGRPRSGGHRWFGWAPGCGELDEGEAALIRQAAADVTAGRSLRSIVLDWNARGVRTSTGRAWTAQSLRQMLLSRRMCGIRTLHDVEVGPGEWPAILTVEESNRVRRVLSDPTRKAGGRKATTMLSGVLRCRCGTKMRAGRTATGRARYQCPPAPDGCGGTAIVLDDTDEEISARLLAKLRRQRLRTSPDGAADIDRLQATLTDLEDRAASLAVDHYELAVISRSQFLAASDALQARIDSTMTELAAVEARRSTTERLRSRDAVLAGWGDMDLAEKRATVLQWIDRIEVAPATVGNRFDAGRLHVAWRV